MVNTTRSRFWTGSSLQKGHRVNRSKRQAEAETSAVPDTAICAKSEKMQARATQQRHGLGKVGSETKRFGLRQAQRLEPFEITRRSRREKKEHEEVCGRAPRKNRCLFFRRPAKEIMHDGAARQNRSEALAILFVRHGACVQ